MLSRKFIKAKDEVAKLYAHIPSPIFRRKFNLDKNITAIRITIGTSGFYRLFLNGKEITKGHMAPYIANPTHYVFYDSYDLRDCFSEGENVIAVLLGNGFQNPSGSVNWFFNEADWVAPLSFAMSLEDISCGRESLLFEADERFLCTDSPYEYDDIRMGVVYDARREIDGILLPDFDDSHFENAKIADTPTGEPKLCAADPIKPRYEIKKKYDAIECSKPHTIKIEMGIITISGLFVALKRLTARYIITPHIIASKSTFHHSFESFFSQINARRALLIPVARYMTAPTVSPTRLPRSVIRSGGTRESFVV